MENIVHLNGTLVPRSKAHISISDHGFLYGFGLFQTMRVYDGRIFLLERHVKRIKESAKIIGLEDKVLNLDLEKACREVVAINDLKNARVRLTVTNGKSTALPWEDPGGDPTVLVTAVPYVPYPAEKYNQGFKVGIATVRRSRDNIVASSLKSLNYMVSVIARMEVSKRGQDEALLLNEDGYLSEGGSSNIFFVRSGRLVTPAVNSGIIPGVTREVVMEIADSLDLVLSEGTVGKPIFKQCEEAFMTNSMIEIMPVTSINDETGASMPVGGGKMGEVTLKLLEAYRERVKQETGG